MSDNVPTMIVLSFNSWCVVSMEGIVPDMERCLGVNPDMALSLWW